MLSLAISDFKAVTCLVNTIWAPAPAEKVVFNKWGDKYAVGRMGQRGRRCCLRKGLWASSGVQ